jgi:hypothetical protein
MGTLTGKHLKGNVAVPIKVIIYRYVSLYMFHFPKHITIVAQTQLLHTSSTFFYYQAISLLKLCMNY